MPRAKGKQVMKQLAKKYNDIVTGHSIMVESSDGTKRPITKAEMLKFVADTKRQYSDAWLVQMRERPEATLEKLVEARRWLAFHSESLDPQGTELATVKEKIEQVEHYLNDVPESEWHPKIDGLWYQAEQIAAANIPSSCASKGEQQ